MHCDSQRSCRGVRAQRERPFPACAEICCKSTVIVLGSLANFYKEDLKTCNIDLRARAAEICAIKEAMRSGDASDATILAEKVGVR
jgi:hypothetical protein